MEKNKMEYAIVSLAPSLLPDVMSFLYLYEHTCVNLIDNLLEKGVPVVPDSADCRVFFADSGTATEICGVIMLLKNGLLLHCIPFDTPYRKQIDYREFIQREIARMLRNRQLFCIMGEGEVSDLIKEVYSGTAGSHAFRTEPVVNRNYELRMYDSALDKTPSEHIVLMKDGYNAGMDKGIRAAGGVPVIQCGVRDVTSLMPLQKEYEIVEVLPPGQEYSERISRLNLVRTMTRYPVFAVPSEEGLDGEGFLHFIAKAGINSAGRRVVQVGGVFTEPKYRCQGIARSLVSMIGRLYSTQRKRVVLFVDKTNTAALRAYDAAGFAFVSSYRIIYY